jgi:hypothetical protein
MNINDSYCGPPGPPLHLYQVPPGLNNGMGLPIEEGRAASKSPHKKCGYFLSISQQGVSADIIQNSFVYYVIFE